MSSKTGDLKNGPDIALLLTYDKTIIKKVRKAPMLKSGSLILMFLSTLFSLSVTAQTTAAGTSKTKATSTAGTPSPWSLGLGLEYSENVSQVEDGPKESGMEMALTPGYKINETFTLSGAFSMIQMSTEDKKPTASNTQVLLAMKGWELTPSIKTVHSATLVLPTSQVSRETDKLQAAFGVTSGMKMTLHPKFETTYRLGLSRNIHEYNINANGSANVEYRLSNSLNIKLILTEKLNLVATGVYRIGRTYEGFERTDFQFDGDINYDVFESLSINVGTSNSGPALKANGVDSNISVYDEKSTVWRVGLSTSL